MSLHIANKTLAMASRGAITIDFTKMTNRRLKFLTNTIKSREIPNIELYFMIQKDLLRNSGLSTLKIDSWAMRLKNCVGAERERVIEHIKAAVSISCLTHAPNDSSSPQHMEGILKSLDTFIDLSPNEYFRETWAFSEPALKYLKTLKLDPLPADHYLSKWVEGVLNRSITEYTINLLDYNK